MAKVEHDKQQHHDARVCVTEGERCREAERVFVKGGVTSVSQEAASHYNPNVNTFGNSKAAASVAMAHEAALLSKGAC